MGFAWNLILFSFMREREGYKHHADCTVPTIYGLLMDKYKQKKKQKKKNNNFIPTPDFPIFTICKLQIWGRFDKEKFP